MIKLVAAAVALFVAAYSPMAAAKGSGGGRTAYGSGKHSSSHGGHYAGGQGSSHRGGSYKNGQTGRNYGTHK